MNIRQAATEDTEVVAQFNAALARESEHLELDLATVRAGVEAVLRDPAKGLYFVAESEGAVVGQLLITHEWSDWRNGDFWWLQSVYVRQDCRGRGVFKALFDHVLALAQRQPEVRGLRLYMEAGNDRARAVYRRLGLKETNYHVLERLK
jgi:GNAT superfamily N-acetyltransferase